MANNGVQNVYLIGGISTIDTNIHSVNTFKVPPGFTFVIKTIDYSTLDRSTIHTHGRHPILIDYRTYFNTIIKLNKDVLLNVNAFNVDNTHVYRANEQCPSIDYTLFMYDDGYYIKELNGIVPINRQYSDTTVKPITPTMNNVSSIESLYEHSILPHGHDIVGDALLEINSQDIIRTWRTSNHIKINLSLIRDKEGIYYSLIITNKPKVYLIGGHGDESLTETFIVPKGCTIVAGNPAGVGIDPYDTANLYSSLIVKNTISTLSTPSAKEHIKKIDKSINKEKIKSLVIYNEGDKCPLFTYRLFALCANIILPYFNGIIDVDIQKEVIPQLWSIDLSTVTNSNTLSELYRYSVYPTPNEVLLYNTDGNDTKIINTWYHNKSIDITQKELCDLYPGVYYNFVCRNIQEIRNHPIVRNINGINSINSLLSISNQRVRNTLKKRIGEAHYHRRPLQYLIHSNGGKTKKRKMIKQKTKKRV